jgi:hypothetical protein
MIVSFVDYTPPDRFDGEPWTTIKIEESTTQDGPWTLIDTKPIVPVDADPSQPATRSFTTSLATLTSGWYRVYFEDAHGQQAYTDPVFNQGVESDQNYIPTVRNVASKIMSRTKDQYGKLIGTFTEDTTPTGQQVEIVVDGIITEVADVIGDQVPEAFVDDAANVAALRAAMQVELDFFSDQVNTGRSIYPQLREQYLTALENLVKALAAGALGPTGTSSEPSYWFPPPFPPALEIVVGEDIW